MRFVALRVRRAMRVTVVTRWRWSAMAAIVRRWRLRWRVATAAAAMIRGWWWPITSRILIRARVRTDRSRGRRLRGRRCRRIARRQLMRAGRGRIVRRLLVNRWLIRATARRWNVRVTTSAMWRPGSARRVVRARACWRRVRRHANSAVWTRWGGRSDDRRATVAVIANDRAARRVLRRRPVARRVDVRVVRVVVIRRDVDVADLLALPAPTHPNPFPSVPVPRAVDPDVALTGRRRHLFVERIRRHRLDGVRRRLTDRATATASHTRRVVTGIHAHCFSNDACRCSEREPEDTEEFCDASHWSRLVDGGRPHKYTERR